MSHANQWVGWGNLTRPPELRILQSGVAVANCGLAVNRSWTDKSSGKLKEETDFFDLSIYGDAAENVCTSLEKGDRVIVVGRIRINRVEDPNGGAQRQYTEINVEEIGPTLRWAETEIRKNKKKDSVSSPHPMEANF